jgi:hypothetical protein
MVPAVSHLIRGGSKCIFVRDDACGGVITVINRKGAEDVIYEPRLILGKGREGNELIIYNKIMCPGYNN